MQFLSSDRTGACWHAGIEFIAHRISQTGFELHRWTIAIHAEHDTCEFYSDSVFFAEADLRSL